MLTLDRLKIKTKSRYIDSMNLEMFTVKSNTKNKLNVFEYKCYSPFFLHILVNPNAGALTIDFTGKILLDEYAFHISKSTIQQCIENINDLQLCKIDVSNALKDSIVCKIDVTIDVFGKMSSQLKTILMMAIKDPKRWRSTERPNGIDIKKNVKSNSEWKERITFYDKEIEIQRAPNRHFLDQLKNKTALLHQFEGKIRIEYNLASGKMIKRALGVESLSLNAVLNASTPVILNICKTIFDRELIHLTEGRTGFLVFEKINDYYLNLLLEKFNDDEQAIEPVFRYFYSPRSNFRKRRIDLRKIRNKRISQGQKLENHLHLFDDLFHKIEKAA